MSRELTELKRRSRAAVNEARLAAGLPPKSPITGPTRRLSPDDPRVLECKRNAGLRHWPYSLERR
jgi:hypothetical protein